MLYLSRKVGESIVINGNIELTITEVKGRSVKIGFNFPPDSTVLRKEVFDKVSAENRSALISGTDLDMFKNNDGK